MERKQINSGENLILSISRLWDQDSSLYFDTKIVCKDGEFLWNRLMLAASSSFLANVLNFNDDLLDSDACLFFPDFNCNIVKSVFISFIKRDEAMGHSSLDALQNFVGTVRIGLNMLVDGKSDLPTNNNGDAGTIKDDPVEALSDTQCLSDDHLDFSDVNQDETYLDNSDSSKIESHLDFSDRSKDAASKIPLKKRGRPRKMPLKFQKNETNELACHSTPKKVGRPKVHPIRDRPFTKDATKEGSTWKCRHCEESFALKKYMSDHLRNNHPEIMSLLWVCELCASVHRSKTSFDYHVETHNENTFLCDVCNKTYNNLRLLKQHQKIYHSGSNFRFVCSQCGKQVESNYKLQKHIESVHERLRRWKCTKCNGCYLSRNNWTRHCKVRHGKSDDSMLKVLSVEEARAVPPFLMNPPNPESRYRKKKLKKKNMEQKEKATQNFKILLPDQVNREFLSSKDKPQFAIIQNIQEDNKDVIVHLNRLGPLSN